MYGIFPKRTYHTLFYYNNFFKMNRRFFFPLYLSRVLPKRTLVKSPEIRLYGLGDDHVPGQMFWFHLIQQDRQ